MRNNKPNRKHPSHGIHNLEHQPTIVFDTVCTKHREPWLANDQVHQLLCQIWRDCTAWLVGRYVIMPDHIHFFATDTAIDITDDDWVKYWKSQFTKRHRHPNHIWQTDHWDTRMRTATAYENKWHYVRHNPVRHNLVTNADHWPYQGQIHNIRW